jgi:hypothetical protein
MNECSARANPIPELYVRWAQAGILASMPASRRGPRALGNAAIDRSPHPAGWRGAYRLIPYCSAAPWKPARPACPYSGQWRWPSRRPAVLGAETQYMLGRRCWLRRCYNQRELCGCTCSRSGTTCGAASGWKAAFHRRVVPLEQLPLRRERTLLLGPAVQQPASCKCSPPQRSPSESNVRLEL